MWTRRSQEAVAGGRASDATASLLERRYARFDKPTESSAEVGGGMSFQTQERISITFAPPASLLFFVEPQRPHFTLQWLRLIADLLPIRPPAPLQALT